MLSRYLASPTTGDKLPGDCEYAHHEARSTVQPGSMDIPQQYLGQSDLQTYETKENAQAGRKRKGSEVDSSEAGDSVNQVRKRISRACDQCNSLRTKCDGQQPCLHCQDTNSSCEYARVHKKRGRAPKKDSIHLPGDAGNVSHIHHGNYSQGMTGTAAENSALAPILHDAHFTNTQYTSNTRPAGPDRRSSNMPEMDNRMLTERQSGAGPSAAHPASLPGHVASYYESFGHPDDTQLNTRSMSGVSQVNAVNGISLNGDTALGLADMSQANPVATHAAFNLPSAISYQSTGLDLLLESDQAAQQGYEFSLGDDFSVAFMGKAPMVESPDWFALHAPTYVNSQPALSSTNDATIRYPVLLPLLPYIEHFLPQSLACDLLEQYFKSSTSAYLRPSNPYILGYVLRKSAVLHSSSPRPCAPALLASMLWISAQVSDATLLTSQPTTRAQTCHQLLELTISLLKPLIHSQAITVPATYATSTAKEDAALGALGVTEGQASVESTGRVQVDNIVTYIHLATVVSASERKAASLRWWNAAWTLGREIRLGRELPPNSPEKDRENHLRGHSHPDLTNYSAERRSSESQSRPGFVSEDEREERRRVWWLLYMMDRHLALCYNRPMFFLNKECETLLQPFDDDVWQSGRFESIDPMSRRRGLNIECTGHSIFGHFLPLMVILGEVLDLNHARNRPRFASRASRIDQSDQQTHEIEQQLKIYQQSLKRFEFGTVSPDLRGEVLTPSVVSTSTMDSQSASERRLQTQTVVAYGQHITHVLYILLTGKWDPIAMLDDNDLWISSRSFVTATGHAVSAAQAVADVIEHDPDLSFMPFFFGVYLLQGSFLLLLFADKLRGDASTEVVRACETIVRAHEACVATLDTQYQRNFRRVMRSALAQVRGRTQDDEQQHHWRREILALYRWTGDGTGLAL